MSATLSRTLSAADSAALAAGGIERDDPFVLARFGDGDLYCMNADTEDEMADMLQATLGDRRGRPPLALADGEEWSPELRDALRDAWAAITAGEHTLLLGDPTTSDFGREMWPYWRQLDDGIERRYIPVHHEMFWLRAGQQPELLRFCRSVRASVQRKLLVGRAELAPAASMIAADFVEVDPFASLRDVDTVIRRGRAYDIVLFCAGRGGKAMIRGLLSASRTLVDVGALFDPLYIGKSRPRTGAASDRDARAFFSELAGRRVTVSRSRPGRAFA